MAEPTLRLRGDIKLADALVLGDLEITLFEALTRNSNLKSWAGCFRTRKNPRLDMEKTYQLKLSDGRSGDISIVKVVIIAAEVFFIGFRAAGHLA